MNYKIVDLFAGIGGIRRGFELAGNFTNVLSAEIDKYACMTYQHLFGENPCNDVTDEKFKRKMANLDYDVLLAGFPCQAFSIAGKKEGFRDRTRGTLFFDIADIIDRNPPKAFLLENVEGLSTHRKGETLRIILETLTLDLNYTVIGVQINPLTGDLNYDPKSFIRNSKDFGVPQNRPRVYIIGFDNRRYGDYSDYLATLELPRRRTGEPIYSNLHEVLDYGKVEDKYYLSEGYLESLKKHKERHKTKGNGYGYIVVNDDENPVSNAILATGGSGKERNLVRDYREGIAGKKVGNKKTPLNQEGIRIMTPSEWGRLQGFVGYAFMKDGEDLFSFPEQVSDTQRYKQLGNSVTVPVIEEIARFMYSVLTRMDSDRAKKVVSNNPKELAVLT